jgi:hypothetical protein
MQDVHGWWGMRGLRILFWILAMLVIAALEQFPFFDSRRT